MKGIIYKWTSPNGKCYIGKDGTGKRKTKFLNPNIPYTSVNWSSKIDRARKKYGVDNFQYKVLQVIRAETKEKLNFKLSVFERMWIKYYNSVKQGYNITSGGEGVLGLKHSEESKNKMRKAHLGLECTQEHRDKISNALKSFYKQNPHHFLGVKQSEELIKKRIEGRKGYRHSKETIQKISDSLKGKPREYNIGGKSVIYYDKYGNIIGCYLSIAEASRRTGISSKNICRYVKGQRHPRNGTRWEYYDKATTEIDDNSNN